MLRRQLIPGISLGPGNNGNGNGNGGNGNGGNRGQPDDPTSSSSLTTSTAPSTSQPASTALPPQARPTVAVSSSSFTPSSSSTTTTSSIRSTTTPVTTSASSTSAPTTIEIPATTIVTIITPTTLVVIGTSTRTSSLAPLTLTSVSQPSSSVLSNDAAVSNTARSPIGAIVGGVVGGIVAIVLAVLLLLLLRKRRRNKKAEGPILWPVLAASPDDQAAIFPSETTHRTSGSGIGGDMEETGLGRSGSGMSYGSRMPAMQPFYDREGYPVSDSTNRYSTGGSADFSHQSHQPLAPGPASIEYHSGPSIDYHAPGYESGLRSFSPSPSFGGTHDGAPLAPFAAPATFDRSGTPFSSYEPPRATQLSVANPDRF